MASSDMDYMSTSVLGIYYTISAISRYNAVKRLISLELKVMEIYHFFAMKRAQSNEPPSALEAEKHYGENWSHVCTPWILLYVFYVTGFCLFLGTIEDTRLIVVSL